MTIPRNEQCPTCNRFDNRGVSIDAVIRHAGRTLLVRRAIEPFKGFWALPGGFVEWDESAEDAVAREVDEETGMLVVKTKQLPVASDPARHPRQVINIPFIVEAEGEPVAGDDAEVVAWFADDELPAELAFDHAATIAAAIEAEK